MSCLDSSFPKPCRNLRYRKTLLRPCIAMTECNRALLFRVLSERIEVDSDAKWRTDFILTAIALADVTVVVPRD